MIKDWQKIVVAKDGTHHLNEGKSFYAKRFSHVLKYHAPGIAPVVDISGAYHIDMAGKPWYAERYRQTFGYYEQRAAVESDTGWFHLNEQGQRSYPNSYAWCGNYQEGFCAVKDKQTHRYYHINKQGERTYHTDYCYVGDYRDGIAVICNDQGMQTHINSSGDLLHNCWFIGLDVYHKSIARAQDEQGWFHIDQRGLPLYPQRYKAIEPYYNNIAVIAGFDGSLFTINTCGEKIDVIRPPRQTLQHELSADLVGFWKTQTIYAAVKLKLFDYLPATVNTLAINIKLLPLICQRLLRALQELALVEVREKDSWHLTVKGQLLTPCALSPMAAAALIWGESHYQSWTQLINKLLLPETDAHTYFESMAQDKTLLAHYQQALSGYAKQDYQKLIDAVDWTVHHTVIDAGGGTGTLLKLLLTQYPHLQGILLEKPAVIALIPERDTNCHYASVDLRERWPVQADAIILARVLHDWSDKDAVNLLMQAKQSLQPRGKIYVLEMILTSETGMGGLLDLNMLVMTGGRERCLNDWQQLANDAQLVVNKVQALTPIVNLLELITHEY